MYLEVRKCSPCTSIIRVPWLSDLGVHVAELMDAREDPYAISNHEEGIFLGIYILDVQEVA